MTLATNNETDLASMFDYFAISVVVSGKPIMALFDHEYVEVGQINGTHPVLTCRTSDLIHVSRGNIVHIDGDNYLIAVVESDGTGVSRVVLEAQT